MAETIGGIEAQLGLDSSNLDAGIVRARQALAAIEGEFRRLEAEQRRGIITTADYTARTNDLAAAQRRLEAAMTSAYSRTATSASQMAVGMNGISTGSGRAAMGILQLSYGLEDLQYGIKSTINNIPPLLMTLGLGAGLTGVLAMASVGLMVLSEHWHTFTTALGMGGVETAAEEMERLGKATGKTAAEQDRLNKLKASEAVHKKVVESRSRAETEAESAVEKALAESGGVASIKGLMEVKAPLHRRGATDEEAIAAARERDAYLKERNDPIAAVINYFKGTEKQVIESINKRLIEENRKTIDDLLRDATEGVGEVGERARRALLNIAEANPGVFPGLAGMLRETTREGRAATESERLIAEGNAGAEAYDRKKDIEEIERKNRAEESNMAEVERDRQAALDEKERLRDAEHDMRRAIGRGELDADHQQKAARDRDRAAVHRMAGERAEEAMGRLPGLNPMAEQAYMQMLAATGGDAEGAQGRLQAKLYKEMMGAGMDMDEAMKKSKELAAGTARGVNEDIMRQAMAGPEVRQSQVMAGADLNRSIQASITNEDKGLRVQENMLKELAEIKRATLMFGKAQPVRAAGR